MCRGTGVKDVLFAQLLMIWLLCRPKEELSVKHQVHDVQNFKNAAHYDLKTVKISLPDGKICSVAQAAINIIDEMKNFFEEIQADVQEILDFNIRNLKTQTTDTHGKSGNSFREGLLGKAWSWRKKDRKNVSECNKESGWSHKNLCLPAFKSKKRIKEMCGNDKGNKIGRAHV